MNYSKLKDICITTQGIQISKDKQINKFKEGYIKYLYIADFKGENEEKFVENVYPEKIVTENDIVMANTGSPGAVFKGINGVLSNNLFKISFDRNILDRDFLYYYLNLRYIRIYRTSYTVLIYIPTINYFISYHRTIII